MTNYEPENFPPPIAGEDMPPSGVSDVSPDNPPWSSWIAFFAWLASVFFVVVIPNVFVIPYLISKGGALSDKAQLAEILRNDSTAILLSVAGIIPAHILTVILAWLVVTKFKKYPFRATLGWRWNGFSVGKCAAIIVGFYFLAASASYVFPEQENELLRILKSSREAVYIVAFLATFTAPFVEEVIYRGILYSAFQRTLGAPLAVALVTILFALVHVPQYYPSYSTILLICLLSLVLTLLRARTKNLLPCVALHTVFNGSQSLILIFQPIIENYVETHQSSAGLIIHLVK